MLHKKILLCILDGFAFGNRDCPNNAVAKAKMPNFEHILSKYPHTMLDASGQAVGLDDGQMGNSEVGHSTIGTGTINMQDLPMINNAIKSGYFFNNEACKKLLDAKKAVHIVGLYSDGGVHGHRQHIKYIAKTIADKGILVNLHIITDGRDVKPGQFLTQDWIDLEDFVKSSKNIKLASVSGRYYAMDRDNKWDRVKLATDAMIFADSLEFKDLKTIVEFYKNNSISDEFIKPCFISGYSGIETDDIVFFANFRADRMRQISSVFTSQKDIYQNIPRIENIAMTRYFADLDASIVFEKSEKLNSLGHIYANLGLNQLRIAETEKYAHVTYFFSGGSDEILAGEDRILIPSPNVATYDLKPEMSAFELKDRLILEMKSKKYDLIVCNIANGDMVGHSGNFTASIRAAEVIDEVAGTILQSAVDNNYIMVITADHGNIEEMIDCDGHLHTQHTLNPVPFIVCIDDKNIAFKPNLGLANIANTILKLANIEENSDMSLNCFQ
ncbi:2,3-bisphosphoglycerate-independent phosphoglycerate mutase [Candidatus Deianiraea vastatrix]|uniref:2,3-bisphosphoglycerate-independent phosphoglycerate mutase n=1 Tax=Candidatus Deianiraea vastatrix TaxID=2163644 RepID=A0A5B8XEJ7_9RICK|nr:2,3-bisphosphoglycerate-independent phosphoglycerate mutase [Candidatus Deianiraea vastatrix]QED23396.1 2,3-bisphosphoglycerate-independent phosphoglycerate mutase [Candidatus Deianiraea vastatrix]